MKIAFSFEVTTCAFGCIPSFYIACWKNLTKPWFFRQIPIYPEGCAHVCVCVGMCVCLCVCACVYMYVYLDMIIKKCAILEIQKNAKNQILNISVKNCWILINYCSNVFYCYENPFSRSYLLKNRQILLICTRHITFDISNRLTMKKGLISLTGLTNAKNLLITEIHVTFSMKGPGANHKPFLRYGISTFI